MFQFRRFPPYTYVFSIRYMDMTPCGFPHSEIPGSKDICSSPRLIAAYRVLLRLPVPRHSPCALSSLTYFLQYQDFSQYRLLDSTLPTKVYRNCILPMCFNRLKTLFYVITSICLLLQSLFSCQGTVYTHFDGKRSFPLLLFHSPKK